jgi:hypothetical protein
MRGFHLWTVEATVLEPSNPLFRSTPHEVLAEREIVRTAELTPNMVVLGNPLPGRSALDAKHRKSPH